MKYVFFLLLFATTISCCSDDKSSNPIDQLPPATQTGANTFGCLLDGKAFKPGNGPNSLDCVYQLIEGKYYFALQANKRNADNIAVLIGLSTNNLQIQEGQTYPLVENIPANAYGTFALAGIFSTTDNINTGQITITKLDEINNVVSGTFWYNIIDFQGVHHEVREGRFDMQYTN